MNMSTLMSAFSSSRRVNLWLSFKRLFDRGCAGRFARLSAGEKGIRTPGPVTDDAFEIVRFSHSIVPVTARNNNLFPSGTNGSNSVCSKLSVPRGASRVRLTCVCVRKERTRSSRSLYLFA